MMEAEKERRKEKKGEKEKRGERERARALGRMYESEYMCEHGCVWCVYDAA